MSTTDLHAAVCRALADDDTSGLVAVIDRVAEERQRLVRLEAVTRAFLGCYLSGFGSSIGAPDRADLEHLEAALAEWNEAT